MKPTNTLCALTDYKSRRYTYLPLVFKGLNGRWHIFTRTSSIPCNWKQGSVPAMSFQDSRKSRVTFYKTTEHVPSAWRLTARGNYLLEKITLNYLKKQHYNYYYYYCYQHNDKDLHHVWDVNLFATWKQHSTVVALIEPTDSTLSVHELLRFFYFLMLTRKIV
jgi:hypothetical protein